MNSDAIILAGGFGTRLSDLARDIPKPMIQVNGRPFLEYVLDYLQRQGIKNVILSTGYLSEVIEAHFGKSYHNIKISYSVEDKPLGTGGAIMAALRLAGSPDCLVMNGDTLFLADLNDLERMHREKNADISLLLRNVDNVGRYGAVNIDKYNLITGFSEKEVSKREGLVNGGIYMIKKESLSKLKMPSVFSLEKDLFSALPRKLKLYGLESDGYFIDIGTPEDYMKAIDELKG